MYGLVFYLIRMRAGKLPKFAVAVLVFAAALVILTGQVGQVAATPTTPQDCYYYGSYSMNYYYWYPYYYYGYPYDCTYSFYYSGYYPYYYSYYGYSYPYDYYYSTPSKYQLTIATDPSDLGTVTGGGTFTSGSSASFSITQNVVQVSTNTRYVFSHWSGDYSGVGSSGSVTMNGATKIVAVYQLQNYLSLGVQPQSAPVPQGAGWYNAGDTATLTSTGQTFGDSASRLVFQGWSVDGQNTQAGASLLLKMDAPHSVVAEYTQQYYLKVLTDQGVAYGEGWYDSGSTAQVFVSTPASTSYGVTLVFNGWQGDIQSNSQSASVVMDKPKTVIASWRTDSTVLYLTIAVGIIAILLAAGIIAFFARPRQIPQSESVHPTYVSETPAKKKPTD